MNSVIQALDSAEERGSLREPRTWQRELMPFSLMAAFTTETRGWLWAWILGFHQCKAIGLIYVHLRRRVED